jgi:hypothetical protein
VRDGDCDIAGVCHSNPTGADPFAAQPACFQRCTTSADCTPGLSCFTSGELGPICVGCGAHGSEDDSKCTSQAICRHNDCTQFVGYAECPSTGAACTISDDCRFQ